MSWAIGERVSRKQRRVRVERRSSKGDRGLQHTATAEAKGDDGDAEYAESLSAEEALRERDRLRARLAALESRLAGSKMHL